ncbi:uncharacterized protein N7518_010391 [Penicillium psychrosexuale]|uniref:uncharacterized protein n=1 Tax=Penicillium psychrosexuale TaxID=1002107 RepID=UPI002544EB51|nr:uncharacterized protein N7518_010391 [Penicillium psychrosexuale]KAJ5781908.1 hypothetical protein N7518_010391 [Penicillium psychrosexuale]
METHMRDSIRQVDENTLLIGDLILHSSSGRSDTSSSNICSWYDTTDNLSHTLTNAPVPLPPTIPLRADDPRLVLVYNVGECSAVWSIGNDVFCKIKTLEEGVTSEATTLAFVNSQKPYFEIPRVIYEAKDNTRSYLFMTRVPGRTLAVAWPTLDETWKRHYVEEIVKVIETLAAWERPVFSGVDGKYMTETYLTKTDVPDFRPQKLTETCQMLGMDCSTFVFYHADLGPVNIIVEDMPKAGTIGIIDWEIAGYVPKGWIRTKFRLSSGLDLPNPGAGEKSHWWRWEVQKLLEERGFVDHAEEWVAWDSTE